MWLRPARVEDFPDVNESDKSVDLMAQTQRVHKTANKSLRPNENHLATHPTVVKCVVQCERGPSA